ncbi:MAG TPA: beta-propeller fold lactonase family protein [Candidatus Sulfotelmatobacter sp.]
MNRAHGTVWEYTIDSTTGNLTTNGNLLTGEQPFRIVVDPSASFAYVANEGGTVSIFRLGSNGTLTAAGSAATSGPMSLAVVGTKP